MGFTKARKELAEVIAGRAAKAAADFVAKHLVEGFSLNNCGGAVSEESLKRAGVEPVSITINKSQGGAYDLEGANLQDFLKEFKESMTANRTSWLRYPTNQQIPKEQPVNIDNLKIEVKIFYQRSRC